MYTEQQIITIRLVYIVQLLDTSVLYCYPSFIYGNIPVFYEIKIPRVPQYKSPDTGKFHTASISLGSRPVTHFERQAANVDVAALEKRREMDVPPAVVCSVDAVPWLLKVQCYLEFWDKFLQELALSKQHSCNVKALSLAASNVWGETRSSTREIYDSEPIVLVPEIFTSHAGLANADTTAPQWESVSEEQAKRSLQDSSYSPSTAAQAAQDAALFSQDSSMYQTETRRPEPLGKSAATVTLGCESNASEANYDGIHAHSATFASSEDEEQVQSDEEEQDPNNVPEGIRSQRYRNNRLLRVRVQQALGTPGSSRWPPEPLSFPKRHLFYDPKQYPILFKEHDKFWTRFSARFLENTYLHPISFNEQKRVYSTKFRITHLQAEILSDCIEWLGIRAVAKALLKPEYTIPFFLVSEYIRLDELTPEELETHLRYVRTPWKSPELRKRAVSWWEMLVQTRSEDGIALSASAKRLLASAHFRGQLIFDRKWLQMACKEPWKSMLETYAVDSSDRKEKQRRKSKLKHHSSQPRASNKLSVRRSASFKEPEVLFSSESGDDSSSNEREMLNQLRRSKGRYKRARYST